MSENHKVYIGCGMVILNPDKTKVLISRRKKEPDLGGLQIPGGTIDYDNQENLVKGVVREILEETGIQIQNPEFLCVINSFYLGKERPIHMIFVGRVESEEIPPNPEPHKAEDWQWISLDNLPDDKWFRMSKIALNFYNDLQKYPNLNRAVIDTEFE